MRPFAAVGAALLGLTGATIVFATGALAGQAGKTLPPGCWKGTGVFQGSFKKGPVSATVNNGKLRFGLLVGLNKDAAALGAMDTTGHGFGKVQVGGTAVDLEVNLTGDFTLHGHPADVIVDGHYRYKGIADFQGTSIPVDIKLPVEDAPLVINSAAGSHATGQFGKSKWTATRIAKLGTISGPNCLKKSGV